MFTLSGANMQSTSDQQFTKVGSFTNWILDEVVAVRASGGATVACSGGIYSSTAKGGNAIVPASASWLGLSGGNKQVHRYDDSSNTAYNITTPYLSLTTGSTAACTADFYIFGRKID